MSTERVLPRSEPEQAENVGDNLAHIFCHVCHGYTLGTPVFTAVTSLCRQFHGIPRRGVRTTLPLCVVCADITDGGTCAAGHKLTPLAAILRSREQAE